MKRRDEHGAFAPRPPLESHIAAPQNQRALRLTFANAGCPTLPKRGWAFVAPDPVHRHITLLEKKGRVSGPGLRSQELVAGLDLLALSPEGNQRPSGYENVLKHASR